MRIVKSWQKFVYIVGVWLVGYVLVNVLLARVAPHSFVVILGTAYSFAQWIVAVRTFRIPSESVERPRAWWRATGRPKAGFILGGILVVLGILSALVLLRQTDISNDFYILEFFFIGIYYLHSSFRLRRTIEFQGSLLKPLPKGGGSKLR